MLRAKWGVGVGGLPLHWQDRDNHQEPNGVQDYVHKWKALWRCAHWCLQVRDFKSKKLHLKGARGLRRFPRRDVLPRPPEHWRVGRCKWVVHAPFVLVPYNTGNAEPWRTPGVQCIFPRWTGSCERCKVLWLRVRRHKWERPYGSKKWDVIPHLWTTCSSRVY